MRKTNILEKLFPSIINVVVVFLISQLFLPFTADLIGDKWTFITVFFLYNIVFLFLDDGRDLGMIVFDTHWEKDYSTLNKVIYAVLATASFSTLLFKIWFTLDLFLINMIVLQLPSILKTGTTLHGLIAGGMVTETKP